MNRTARLRALSLGAAALALTLSLAGNDRLHCAPVPVEPACVGAGDHVWPWDPNGPDCCEGLVATVITEIDPATGECVALDGAMQCLACGDGTCGDGEDACSCPADCAADCVPAGGYVFPWDPSYGVCCPGLHTASTYDIDENGECQALVGGAVCIACGDGACGAGEDGCNCAADCAEGCGGLPEDLCAARAGCEPGYHGFCDCTCPGPPGYEGGGCPGCGAECFVYAACVTVP